MQKANCEPAHRRTKTQSRDTIATTALARKAAFTLQVKVSFGPKDHDTFRKHFRPVYDLAIN
ncbi:uncharacterized protein RAG0_15885 [Rhynchosporium agropyri]|uniref:Uncharacterized protein n=1 Tax=Rhynchosporium agropyri TaxID=914238 RepID=A0A1E1LMX8_9HELO|nr:uncharacterized protein RAG0_15885 [Rhynchosporium agropyri]